MLPKDWQQPLNMAIPIHPPCLCHLQPSRQRQASDHQASQMHHRHRQPTRQHRISVLRGKRALVPSLKLPPLNSRGTEGRHLHDGGSPHPTRIYQPELVPQQQHSRIPRHAISHLADCALRSDHWRSVYSKGTYSGCALPNGK